MSRSSQHFALALSLALTGCVLAPAAHAQFAYSETEGNNNKATANTVIGSAANAVNIGTDTSGTITGSTTASDGDYFLLTTNYQTAGIYVNTLQLNNTSQIVGSLRGLSQSAGAITPGSDATLQTSTSTTSNSAYTPYGLNKYYSFGGAGKTQSMYYRAIGATGVTTPTNYTATFTSRRLADNEITDLGSFAAGSISFNSLNNQTNTGITVNTEIYVFDSNFNLYYDSSGRPANNDNPSSADTTFDLTRDFGFGTYYVAIGLNNTATNDAAASDDFTRGTPVTDFDNVIMNGSPFYNNGTTTRPTDFSVSDGTTTVTTSGQQISSIYGINFYRMTVGTNAVTAPEPGSIALLGTLLLPGVLVVRRRFRRA